MDPNTNTNDANKDEQNQNASGQLNSDSATTSTSTSSNSAAVIETGDNVQPLPPRTRHQYDPEDRRGASISLPIPPQPDSRGRFRKVSGPGDGHGRDRKISDTIQIHPSRVGSMSSSRRSYSRGAFFGDIPEQVGSYMTRRLSQGSLDSDGNLDGEDQGLGTSDVGSVDSGSMEGLLGGQKSYMSKISISMNRSLNPVTGETLFWGFSKKQWFLLFVFSIADLLAGVVYSLQAPFYPQEAEKHNAKPTEYGLVFGVFELAMFICSPIYGKYMSKLGPRNVFNVGIFITGTSCILFGLLDRVEDKWSFIYLSFAIRTVEAIGNAGFATATFTIIAMEFPDSVATTFASLETFFGFGLIVGPTVGGGLYQLGGYTLPFVVTGGAIFTTALLVAIFMPKPPVITDSDSKGSAGYGILTILKIPGVLLATTAIIVSAISIGFLSSTLEPHIRQFKLSPLATGLVFVINGGVYALTAPGWGWLCDRVKQTKYITLTGAICLTVGFMMVGPIPNMIFDDTILWVTCVGLFIQGLGVGATFVSSFILALRHSIASGLPDDVATYSVVSGLWSSVLALGLFIGPSVAGVLYDWVGFRFGSLFVVGSGFILIFMIILFLLCNGKAEAEYYRSVQASRSNSSPASRNESDPLLGSKDDVPDAIIDIAIPKSSRQSYGATTTANA